jgi:hypothetical protein
LATQLNLLSFAAMEGKFGIVSATVKQLDDVAAPAVMLTCTSVMLLQIAYGGPLAWWTVFLPLWIGHGGHLLLVLSVLLNAVGAGQSCKYVKLKAWRSELLDSIKQLQQL